MSGAQHIAPATATKAPPSEPVHPVAPASAPSNALSTDTNIKKLAENYGLDEQRTRQVVTFLEANQRNDNRSSYVSAKHNPDGDQTRWWQQQLNAWLKESGYSNFQIPEDGKWSKEMKEVVQLFQRSNGLDDDGTIGPRTFRKMALHLNKDNPNFMKEKYGISVMTEEEFNQAIPGGYKPIAGATNAAFRDVKPISFSGQDPFETALSHTLGAEGGYSNHPSDRGGATYKGITWRTYADYLGQKNADPSIIKQITDQEVREIYYKKYWLEANCDKLPPRVAVAQFDAAVNHGVGGANGLFKGAMADTGFSVSDLQKANELEQDKFIRSYLSERGDLYAQIIQNDPSQGAFARGWNNRLVRQARALLSSGSGVG